MVRNRRNGGDGRAKGTDTRQISECHGKHRDSATPGPSRLPKVAIELQQRVLNIFRDAFSLRNNHELPRLLQEVKKNLYNRDFRSAFGGEALLETYAFRWCPSRALAYMEIFCTISPLPIRLANICSNQTTAEAQTSFTDDNAIGPVSEINAEARSDKEQQPHSCPPNDSSEGSRIVCIGGGSGAELMALAGYLHSIGSAHHDSHTNSNSKPMEITDLNITILDMADWSNVIHTLHSGATTSPPISAFATPAKKATNTPLVHASHLHVDFQHCDILSLSLDQLRSTFTSAVKLVTLMFTLNELYSTSIKATTTLLLTLTSTLPPGALLLVVDSPGSYSTVDIGSKNAITEADNDNNDDTAPPKKNYPMHWLLDHTLLESASIDDNKSTGKSTRECGNPKQKRWEKIHTNESIWFRRPPNLRYPIDLEDMRYQIHLYERV